MARVTVDRLKKLFLKGIDDRYAPAFEEIAGSLGALIERVGRIERELDDFDWKGVWDEGAHYVKRNSVSFGGSLWLCRKNTTSKPGSSDDWKLIVKRGRDGRDRGA